MFGPRCWLAGAALLVVGCSSGDMSSSPGADAAVLDQSAPPPADGGIADATTGGECDVYCPVCQGMPRICGPNCPGFSCPVSIEAGVDAGRDASSAADAGGPGPGPDAGYAACFAADGGIAPSLKTCTTVADCTYVIHGVNCCGATEQVGIATSEQGAFTACETAWQAHFPACGCFSQLITTEDGKTSDGGPPQLRCAGAAASPGSCETFTP